MEMKNTSKLTLKYLSQELNSVKEDLKEAKMLKETVSSLEKRLLESETRLKLLEESLVTKGNAPAKDCKKCDKTFESGQNLNHHVKEMHQHRISCGLCENSFKENFELEYHMKTCHTEIEKFKCSMCEKTFVLKWRMDKHQQNHSIT